MILYFENSFGKLREIAQPKDCAEASAAINQFLKEHNYTSYYTRTWINPKNSADTIFDVGSHSEFFHLIDNE